MTSEGGDPGRLDIFREEPGWRALAAIRRGFDLSAVALLADGPGGRCVLAAGDAAPGVPMPAVGTGLADLGAAAGAWRTRRAVLLNQDAPRGMAVPYAARPLSIGGAAAFPVLGGLVWADRAGGPLSSGEFEALQEVCRLGDALAAGQQQVREAAVRIDALTATVEGVRAVLAVSSERDAVAALAEAVGRESGASLVLIVLFGAEPADAVVVGGSGAGAREVVGRTFAHADGMVGLAVRTGVVVPPGGRYQSSMGAVLSPGIPVHPKTGEALAVLLLGSIEDPLGAVVRVGGDPGVPIHGTRTLADAATLLIRQFRLRERVARDAMFDMLTGLYNRRALSARLSEAFALARRHGQELGLVMLDADHFKSVNDLHGHPVGDRVLRALADEIRAGMRESDFAGRYGGEEFAVVLPNADVEGAVAVAERIRGRFAMLALPAGTTTVMVTVSAGVAVLRPGMAGPQELVASADAALYAAKRAGRNRVEVAGRGAVGRKGEAG